MSQSNKKEIKVCVTGASGYLASHVVKDLLEQGYTVHGTVRRIGSDSSKHLTTDKLCPNGCPGELKLFSADLLNEGAFAEAIEGCTFVVHTASPFHLGKPKDPQAELVDPALKGTTNVLQSCSSAKSVKRVVLTSSVVATIGDLADKDTPVDESDWNTTSTLKEGPYPLSKTLAERKAWELAKNADWELVTINPGFITGPTLSGRVSDGSFTLMKQILSGGLVLAPTLKTGVVDVRDAAKAHRLAFENESAKDRHIAVTGTYSLHEMGDMIREKYKYSTPKYTIPKPLFKIIAPLAGYSRHYVAKNVGVDVEFNSSKFKALVGDLIPIKQSLHDMVENMIEHGMVKRK